MKKSIFFISLLLMVQLTIVAQDMMNKLPISNIDLEYYQAVDYYRGDTVILIDSTINYSYSTGTGIPTNKTWYRERDAQGRQSIIIYYSWDNLNEIFYANTSDSLIYYNDNSVKEKYTKSYDRVMDNWKHSAYLSYNSHANLLIEESLNWDATIGQYYMGSQVISTYLSDTLLISELTNKYDTAIAGWQNKSLIEIVRNDFGYVITDQSKIYDESINDWKTIEKIEYVRNENSLVSERTTSQYNYEQNMLAYVNMTEYFYDAAGNDTLSILRIWDNNISDWKQYSKTNKKFDQDNKVIVDLDNSWNDELNEWYPTWKKETVYNEYGDFDTITYSKWYLAYSFWYGKDRHIYEFSDNHVLLEVLNQEYDLVYGVWENYNRAIWEYENDKLRNYIFDWWDDSGVWYHDTYTTRSYNAEGLLDTIVANHFGSPETSWDIIERTIITYGEHGEILELQYDHNHSNTNWVLEKIISYYYSEYVLFNSVSENLQLDFQVFPNPSKGVVSISLPEMIGKRANLSVFDINGRLIKSLVLNDKSPMIDLSELTKGIYLINISDGVQHGTKRLIIN